MEITETESANRLALVGIIVSDADAVETVNAVLHEYGKSILGRMGLPVRERGVNAISIVVDAPADAINSLTGRLGRINGVAAKALFQKL
ncbi:MAG: iron-only hydrogenase system regulator [Clostridia bacterium]|jgi:putative iron-only hydrogenase system regulator|nr:iron-only hydrogenase system regulator [Clostridia bacterium]MCI9459749.1 iron-only hydrogenase system regulator [Clostridia bacterium]